MSNEFVMLLLLKAIHQESINHQEKVINTKEKHTKNNFVLNLLYFRIIQI